GDHLRRPERPQEPGLGLEGGLALLHPARRAQRARADHLPRARPQREPGAFMSETAENLSDIPSQRAPLVLGARDFHAVTERISSIVEVKTPPGWVLVTLFTFSLLLVLGGSLTKLVLTGVGVWGLQNTVGWAWDITGFVFWIGIGHAGTLISAILHLF